MKRAGRVGVVARSKYDQPFDEAALITCSYLLGALQHSRDRYRAEMLERARLAEAQLDREAEQRVIEEWLRIARASAEPGSARLPEPTDPPGRSSCALRRRASLLATFSP